MLGFELTTSQYLSILPWPQNLSSRSIMVHYVLDENSSKKN